MIGLHVRDFTKYRLACFGLGFGNQCVRVRGGIPDFEYCSIEAPGNTYLLEVIRSATQIASSERLDDSLYQGVPNSDGDLSSSVSLCGLDMNPPKSIN